MTCEGARALFSAHVDGALEPSTVARLHDHLATCPACQQELARFQQIVNALQSMPEVRAPAGLVPRVMAEFPREPWPRRLLRSVLLPLPVKLPLEAAAMVLVGILTVVLYRGSPSLRSAVDEAPTADVVTRSAPAATGALSGPASPSIAARGETERDAGHPEAPPATTSRREAFRDTGRHDASEQRSSAPSPATPPEASRSQEARRSEAGRRSEAPRSVEPDPPGAGFQDTPRSEALRAAEPEHRGESREPSARSEPRRAESSRSDRIPPAPPQIGGKDEDVAGATREAPATARQEAPAAARPEAPATAEREPAAATKEAAGAANRRAMSADPGSKQRQLVARARSTDVEAKLRAKDRSAADRALPSLLERVGATLASRSAEGSIIVIVVPRAGFTRLASDLKELGDLTLETVPDPLPDPVRVTLRLGS
jgi:Putative zinc-finger